ncbi:MAG: helix-turn-helix domain-containing protein [bacterium]|nr:helix-turn-helix domain-containing protein [bacterium]
MNDIFGKLFTQIGYTSKEAQLFLELYKLGNQPASTIAKRLAMERTGVYKSLCRMAAEGIVHQTKTKGVTHFFVPSDETLLHALRHRQQQLETITSQYDEVTAYLKQQQQAKYPYLPKIALFDGIDGIKSLYRDIYETVITDHYLVIKFFASNTFESQTTVHMTLKEFSQDIFRKLAAQHVTIDTYL